MSLQDVLATVQDSRKQDDRSSFHGFLEDYLSIIEQDNPNRPILEQLFNLDQQSRVIVDLVITIHKDVISNQIISYKDALKLPTNHLKCPLLVYGINQQNQSYGIILYPGMIDDYLLAKGIYFSLSEQGAIFQHNRNDLFACTTECLAQQPETIIKIVQGQTSIGSLQREFDRKYFPTMHHLETSAQAKALAIKELTLATLTTSQQKQELIYDTIGKWYLCKKATYVQVMTNKLWLNELFENNIKKQRHQAKVLSDSLIFMPLSELWRL